MCFRQIEYSPDRKQCRICVGYLRDIAGHRLGFRHETTNRIGECQPRRTVRPDDGRNIGAPKRRLHSTEELLTLHASSTSR